MQQSLFQTIEDITPDLIAITLSKPVPQAQYKKIRIRQVGATRRFFAEQFTETQSFQKMMNRSEIAAYLHDTVGVQYKNAVAELLPKKKSAPAGSRRLVHFLTNKKGKTTVLCKEVQQKSTPTDKTPLPKTPAAAMVSPKSAADLPDTAPLSDVSLTNRRKKYLLPEGVPVPFLVKLGVMTDGGKVTAPKYDKFRQINRFLEFADDILPEIISARGNSARPLRIIDFGCGKSYLTFALYHFLTEIRKIPADITGLDLKESVIQHCAALAAECGCTGLHFQCGDIASYAAREAAGTDAANNEAGTTDTGNNTGSPETDSITDSADKSAGSTIGTGKNNGSTTGAAPLDLVITLHACDTATDYALAYAVKNGAQAILSVPCCQHELNTAYNNANIRHDAAAHVGALLSYGIIRERFAALATDTMRAELLESAGYKTQILEFIDMEHTPKNLLIRAVRKHSAAPAGTDGTVSLQHLSDGYSVLRTAAASGILLEKLLAP